MVNEIRASDRDRERVASILRTAAAEGLLTLDETDERMAAAYAAKYRHELAPLTADLPGDGDPLSRRGPEAGARRAEFRGWARTRLTWHAAAVAALFAVAVTGWAFSGARHFFPAPLLFLGVISLVLHARRLGFGGGWGGRAWDGPGPRGYGRAQTGGNGGGPAATAGSGAGSRGGAEDA